MKEYKTTEIEAFDEFVEKKSKFICYSKPISTVEDANDFIKSIKTKHWDATHNVYAYVLKDGYVQRYSDDGEPSGTAGVPVLDVIIKENIVDVCVVVTRYFGGTLLGTGGLVRAYSHGSKLALDAGNIITMAPCKIFKICVDYSFYDRTVIVLNQFSANVNHTEFSENISITFSINACNSETMLKQFSDLFNGKAEIIEIGEQYAKI